MDAVDRITARGSVTFENRRRFNARRHVDVGQRTL
jgi:hypothetical protein